MNELTHDLKEKLEDPRFWTDEYLQQRVKEILEKYSREGTPVGCEEAARKAREFLARYGPEGKGQARWPVDIEREVHRCVLVLADVKDTGQKIRRDLEPTELRYEK